MISLKFLFTINSLVAFSYGFGALFAPDWVMGAYGLSLTLAGELMTRFYAAELIAHGWMTWQARNAAASTARSAIVSSRSIGNAVRTVVAIAFMATGGTDFRGYFIIALFASFSLAYAYFWLFKKDTP